MLIDLFRAGMDEGLDILSASVARSSTSGWSDGDVPPDDGRARRVEGIDDQFATRSMAGLALSSWAEHVRPGARRAVDDTWRGWLGDDPPYHRRVRLTRFAPPPIEMEGVAVFHFVTEGIRFALDRAQKAAGDLDVKIGGGVSTVRQYLIAGLIDELHLAIAPVLLGRGEALLRASTSPVWGSR